MSASPRRGSLLGDRYRLEREIGSGGMATVWAATDVELDRPVAVKVISETLAHDAAFMGRFRREARIAAAFTHPNVVRVYDFSGEAERPFLVMQRLEGGTLDDRLADPGPAVDPVVLTEQLLSALDQIHGAGVVHRDVKPANVLFDAGGTALLTDFGIAHSEEATRYTQAGRVIGTLKYMAPEQQRGEDPSPRSDLYSLGILLRECFADLPPALAGLVASLTATDPAERPASAAGARQRIETSTAATAPIEGPPTVPRPASRPLAAGGGGGGASRWGLALGLAALVAVVAAALALGLGRGGDDGASDRGSTATTSSTATTTVTEQQTETTTASDPSTASTPAPTPVPEPTDSSACAQLEEQKKQLEDEKKSTEKALKDDKEAKEAAKQQFEEQKHALDEQLKACKESEKAG